jgi:hypothetical protein
VYSKCGLLSTKKPLNTTKNPLVDNAKNDFNAKLEKPKTLGLEARTVNAHCPSRL